jgi:hypothetical protein
MFFVCLEGDRHIIVRLWKSLKIELITVGQRPRMRVVPVLMLTARFMSIDSMYNMISFKIIAVNMKC